jgi:hypothetical protein
MFASTRDSSGQIKMQDDSYVSFCDTTEANTDLEWSLYESTLSNQLDTDVD